MSDDDGKTPDIRAAASALARLGGAARAKALSRRRRSEIARMGALAQQAARKKKKAKAAKP